MAKQQRATVRPEDVPPGGLTTAPAPQKPRCDTCRFWSRQGEVPESFRCKGGPVGYCQWEPPGVQSATLTEWGPVLIHGLTLATQGCFRHEPSPDIRPTTEQQR